ncbi:MAG: hypothetical protein CMB77_06995 [Euryarchaeota archaeon]|nr:hypothetical protein [Euryarchaeota archaeon]
MIEKTEGTSAPLSENVVDGPWGAAKGGFPIPGGMWREVLGMMVLTPVLVEAIYAIARGVDDPQALAAEVVDMLEDNDDDGDV